MKERLSYHRLILKRLFHNRIATVSLAIIGIFCLVSLLGYLIMPDSTPDANDGIIQLRKKLPGFKVTLIKIRKSIHSDTKSFFQKMVYGQESDYVYIPVESYRIEGLFIYAKLFEESNIEKKLSLVGTVRHLYTGRLSQFRTGDTENYTVTGNEKIVYVDVNQKVQYTTRSQLVKEFENKYVERKKYLLGTDLAGRDLLSRIILGARISVSIGLIAVTISMVVGVFLGSLAGFLGGWVDKLVLWMISVFWSIPSTMLVIAISLALQSRGVWVAFVAVGLTTWVDIARMVRGEILSIKEKPYIDAARVFGISNRRIVVKHILPNIMSSLVVVAASSFASAILIEAGLSFLGLSVQPPTPSWGMMIHEGFRSITGKDSWHLILFPSLAVSLLVLCFNLLGSGLRDAYDPRTVILRNTK